VSGKGQIANSKGQIGEALIVGKGKLLMMSRTTLCVTSGSGGVRPMMVKGRWWLFQKQQRNSHLPFSRLPFAICDLPTAIQPLASSIDI
jgi:hypothetical protein